MNGGRVLIPCFAIGRAQEVLLILRQAIAAAKTSQSSGFCRWHGALCLQYLQLLPALCFAHHNQRRQKRTCLLQSQHQPGYYCRRTPPGTGNRTGDYCLLLGNVVRWALGILCRSSGAPVLRMPFLLLAIKTRSHLAELCSI